MANVACKECKKETDKFLIYDPENEDIFYICQECFEKEWDDAMAGDLPEDNH